MANPRIITNGLDKTSLSERVQKNQIQHRISRPRISRSLNLPFALVVRGFEEFFFFIQLVKDKLNHLKDGTSHCRPIFSC